MRRRERVSESETSRLCFYFFFHFLLTLLWTRLTKRRRFNVLYKVAVSFSGLFPGSTKGA